MTVRGHAGRQARTGLGVLVGIDGSPGAAGALRFAVDEARLRGRHLTICHVAPAGRAVPGGATTSRPDEIVEEAVLRVARIAAGQVPVRTRLETGHSGRVLAALAGDAELIVVGSRGRGGFAGLVLGSVGLHVALHAPGPVVVVRPRPPTRGPFVGQVVVGVDGSSVSQAALEFGFAEADRRGCGLVAVHVSRLPDEDTYTDDRTLQLYEEQRAPGRDLLDAVVDPLAVRYPRVPVRRALHQAPVAAGLLRAAAGCLLLAVGRTGRGAAAGLLFGSVTHAMIHHARCPVAVVA